MRFNKNLKTEKCPLTELYEMLMLTDEELENWKEIQIRYNLKFLSATEKAA